MAPGGSPSSRSCDEIRKSPREHSTPRPSQIARTVPRLRLLPYPRHPVTAVMWRVRPQTILPAHRFCSSQALSSEGDSASLAFGQRHETR